MRIGRTRELCWNDFKVSSFNDFITLLENFKNKSFLSQQISTNRIILIPYGNNGGSKKGIEINADNSKYFECSEVIWKAKKICEAVNNKISNGIGIFRYGFEKELPSYYIGEYIDKANLLKE